MELKSVASVSGQIIYARPNKTLYDQYEEITLSIKGETTYKANWDFSGEWRTYFSVYDEAGKVVGEQGCYHTISPLTREDTAVDVIQLRCGRAARPQNLRVRLVFMPSMLTAEFTFLDDVYVPIRVAEAKVEPSPIPPEPVVPEPIPAPAPTPTPTPPVTVGPTPTPPVRPTPTPTPPKAESKWLVPALIAGFAVLLLMPPGKEK